MNSAADRKMILVTRKTRLEELMIRYHSEEQVRFYLEHLGADFEDYLQEHQTFMMAKKQVQNILSEYLRRQFLERTFVKNYLFGPDDVVIVLGSDGLVANTMKYLNGQALIGVNPDPKRYDGVLLPFDVPSLAMVIKEVVLNRRTAKTITMAQVTLSDQQTLYAVNDFFIGAKTHISARYTITLEGAHETQSSSGIIVSTGLGSGAWMKSVVTGAQAITQTTADTYQALPWHTNHLLFAVREPFISCNSQASLVFGKIKQAQQMIIRSNMPENGVIFSDGIEEDFLPFNAGAEAKISIAQRNGQLIWS